jgi:D-alanyl-lipoteichoic acid acyltransferase DltB (MBOAT superfamily)
LLFTSYKYALFVVLAFAVYWLASRLGRGRGRPVQNLVLLLLSYLFYALWDWRWCLLLAGVTATGFAGALTLEHVGAGRRWVLIAVLVADLAALGLFKYYGWFADSFASLLSGVGLHADWVTLNLVLPIGISYYVFQNLSYVIDVYRRELPASRDAVGYGVALGFFPQLLAGPITRPRDLLPQLAARRDFDDARARDGLRQVLWGLTKKMLIADNVGAQVDYAWAHIGEMDGASLLLVAVLYSVQIYCDFSGYADIAIGSAKLFNLRLSKNFDYPYFSVSMRMFWRRWHITLASWMRDYVYIPLGGSRVGAWRHVFNLMATFLLVGLWHGASLTFLVWGGLHGLYLSLESRLRGRRPTGEERWSASRAVASGVLVFALVTFAWVFFRAPTLAAATDFLVRAVTHPAGGEGPGRFVPVLLLSAALFAYEWLTRGWEHGLSIAAAPLPARWATYLGLCMALLVFGYLGASQAIYVQF